MVCRDAVVTMAGCCLAEQKNMIAFVDTGGKAGAAASELAQGRLECLDSAGRQRLGTS